MKNKVDVTSNWHLHETTEKKDGEIDVPKLDKTQIVQATLEEAEKVKLTETKKVAYPEQLTSIFQSLGLHVGRDQGPKGVRAYREKRNAKAKLIRKQQHRG